MASARGKKGIRRLSDIKPNELLGLAGGLSRRSVDDRDEKEPAGL